jgi:hypothetical protein
MSKTRTPAKGPVARYSDSGGQWACPGALERVVKAVLWVGVLDMLFRLDLVDYYF